MIRRIGRHRRDGSHYKGEALEPSDQTLQTEVNEEESTPVTEHQRKKREPKPLDPALIARAVRNLNSRNQGEQGDVIMRASGRDISAGDLAAAAWVTKAISVLPTINLLELLL